LAVAAVIAATWALRQTTPGLSLRSVGDDPEAAQLRGVDVISIRIATLVLGGALAGIGGATITVGYLGSFSDDVTSGRGHVDRGRDHRPLVAGGRDKSIIVPPSYSSLVLWLGCCWDCVSKSSFLSHLS
jgi:Branched-chain amino acid transport system / permease component